MAARVKIIVLEKDPSEPVYRYVLWADVPIERQPFYANPTAQSAWTGATASDLTALQNGSVVERAGELRLKTDGTLAQAQAELQTRWAAFQNDITSQNKWARYGTTWDGTNWTAGGVN